MAQEDVSAFGIWCSHCFAICPLCSKESRERNVKPFCGSQQFFMFSCSNRSLLLSVEEMSVADTNLYFML